MKPKKSLFSRGGHATAFVTAVTFCVAGQSFAAEYDWNAATADFNNAANWSVGGSPAPGVPGAVDIANIANGGHAQWTTNSAKTVQELRIGNGAAGTVSISGGNAFTSSNGALVGRQGGATIGTLNVSGVGTIFNVTTGNTHVGTVSHVSGTTGAGATGVLNISAGAVFNHQPNGDESFIIGNNLTPANTQVQAGTYKGTLNVNGGTLNVLNGSRLYVAQSAGSEGEMNVSSGGAVTVSDDHLIIGRSGKGTLNFSGGTITKSGGGNFAAGDLGGTSVVNHTGGTLNVAGGEFRVGQGAGTTGTYTLGAGAALNTNFWTTIGREGGTGTFNLNGGTITKNGGGQVMVGAYDGGPSTGVFNHNSGTVDIVSGELWVGQGSNPEDTSRATGTYNLDGGSVNVNNWVAVGRERGIGTMNISGTGKLTKTGINDNHLVIGQGNSSNSSGTLTVTEDGIVDIKAGQLWISENSPGKATISGNGTINAPAVQVARFAAPAGGGEFNLNGGTLQTGRIFGGAGIATVNFNGTAIKATANENFFIETIDTATIQAGGLKIDSGAFNLTVGASRPPVDPPIPAQVLTGPGGITKNGEGSLNLIGAQTYSGPTVVNAGKLTTSTASSAATGAITVGTSTPTTRASFGLNLIDFNQKIEPLGFTITQGNIDINLAAVPDTAEPPLDVNGTLTLNGTAGTNVVNLASDSFSNLAPGVQIPLIRYNGTIAGSGGFASLKVGTLPVGMTGTLVHDQGNKIISLNITRLSIPAWRGFVSNVWNTSAANWSNTVGDFLGDTYANGDPVLFPDDADSDRFNVQLATTVTPGAYVLFNNSNNNYTLSGAGKISGTTRLIKRGTGSVTISTAANDFTGGVLIEGGSVITGSLSNGGAPSPIGAAAAAPANLLLSGGTLAYTGANATTNRGFTIGAINGGIEVTNAAANLTVSGIPAATAGGLVKKGAGILTLTGSGAIGVIGDTQAVRVELGKLVLTSPAAINTQIVTSGELWVGNTVAAPASMDITNTTLNSNSWLAVGRGNGDNTSSLNISGGSVVSVVNISTGFVAGQATNNSTQNITIANSTLNNSAQTLLGESRGATTNLTVTGNSTLNTREVQAALGGGASVGATTVNITLQDDSTWNVGTQANIAYASIGRNGGTGNLTVKGNAKFLSYDDVSLAEQGTSTGTITIQDNATVTIRTGLLGRGVGGTGLVNQSGGSFTSLSNSADTAPVDFEVGVSGNAIYNLTGGTASTAGRTGVARNAGSVSSLNVSGGTFTHNNVDRLFHIGSSGNGTLDVSGNGQVISKGGLYVGSEASGVGTLKQTGGVIDASKNIILGDLGKATVNLSGGQLRMLTGGGEFNFVVGNNVGGQATLNISQTADVRLMNNASLRLGNTNSGGNEVNQSGGAVTFYSNNGTTVGGTGSVVIGLGATTGTNTYTLSGGTLTTGEVRSDAPASTSRFYFNGGTLKASGNNANFMHNLSVVEINSNGATIDSNSFNVTVNSPLLLGQSGGGLTKTGAGTLTLAGVNTYAGNTVISAGGITLADNAQLRFVLGANGVNNSITGTGAAALNGDFLIQNVPASIANGNSWTLVAGSVNESYGASFNVIGYTESNNVWTKVEGGNTWTFSEATGALTLTTGGVSDPYTTWTNTYFPGVTDQNIIGRNADPDGDGSSNALEFALGGVPNNGANNPKVYSLQADGSVDSDTDKELLLTIAVRAQTPAFSVGTSPTAAKDGVTYTIQGSLDLTGFNTGVTEVSVVVPPTAPPNPPIGYEYRTFSLNGSNNLTGKGFLRVRVN